MIKPGARRWWSVLGLAVVAAGVTPRAAAAQFFPYYSPNTSPYIALPGRRNVTIMGGPLGPAPLDPYSIAAAFGYLPSPLVARQTIGHQVISTGPNSYVYRPVYADQTGNGVLADVPPAAGVARPTVNPRGTIRSLLSQAQGGRLVPSRQAAAGRPGGPAPADIPLADGGRQKAAEIRDLYAAAQFEFRSGHYTASLEVLRQLLDREPKHGLAELLAAQVHFALGQYQPAAEALQRALPLLPERDWDRFVAHYRDYFPSALRYILKLRALERFVREQPQQAEGHLLLGYHYCCLGFRDEGLAELDLVQGDRLADKLREHFRTSPVGDEDLPAAGGPAPDPEMEKGEMDDGERPARGDDAAPPVMPRPGPRAF